MEKLEVRGANVLNGQVKISGSKNASLPILALSILAKNFEVKNIPNLADVSSMLNLLKSLGVNYNFKDNNKRNAIKLESSDRISSLAKYDLKLMCEQD